MWISHTARHAFWHSSFKSQSKHIEPKVTAVVEQASKIPITSHRINSSGTCPASRKMKEQWLICCNGPFHPYRLQTVECYFWHRDSWSSMKSHRLDKVLDLAHFYSITEWQKEVLGRNKINKGGKVKLGKIALAWKENHTAVMVNFRTRSH